MRVIFKEPGEPAEVKYIENTLEALQGLVGGYIEHLAFNNGIGMIMNEEGKLKNMEPNFRYGYDMIVGPAIFVGESGEDLRDISEDEALKVLAFLRWHEVKEA